MTEQKSSIQNALGNLAVPNLSESGLTLFQALGYATERRAPLAEKTAMFFVETYAQAAETTFNQRKALCQEWAYVDLTTLLCKKV